LKFDRKVTDLRLIFLSIARIEKELSIFNRKSLVRKNNPKEIVFTDK
jgi:hypothetical protein